MVPEAHLPSQLLPASNSKGASGVRAHGQDRWQRWAFPAYRLTGKIYNGGGQNLNRSLSFSARANSRKMIMEQYPHRGLELVDTSGYV